MGAVYEYKTICYRFSIKDVRTYRYVIHRTNYSSKTYKVDMVFIKGEI